MFKLILASAVLVAAAAAAQAPNEAPDKTQVDMNEVICIDQPTTGSRVNKVRVCRTRAQWAASRVPTKDEERSRNRRGED